jgi:regulator of RNase E activity RraA
MSPQKFVPWGEDPVDKTINSSMISDSLDKAGARDRVIKIALTPLSSSVQASGMARTIRFTLDPNPDPPRPYDDMMDFIDGVEPGELVVIATDESDASAFWGELFSAVAIGRGGVGLVTDGAIRDVEKIRALKFPVFARGRLPVDYRGRTKVDAVQEEVIIGGVPVSPGDLVVADEDGVVVVPESLIDTVVELARERARGESTVLKELLEGSSLRDVWTRYGIL